MFAYLNLLLLDDYRICIVTMLHKTRVGRLIVMVLKN